MTKLSIKLLTFILIALLMLSFFDRFSLNTGKVQLVGLWMFKAHNLATIPFFPALNVQVKYRAKIDATITQYLRKNQAYYGSNIGNTLATKSSDSLLHKAALGLADAVKDDSLVQQQLAIIARQHPSLKVRCFWQAQLNQGTIVTVVNSPGPSQVVSQYLVLPENNCPAKELDKPPIPAAG